MSTGWEKLLEGRRALVTGGANGIGAAIVSALAQAGAHGVVLDLPAALGGELPAGWSAMALDLLEDDSVARAFGTLATEGREFEIVVAAAGVVPGWSDLGALDLRDWDRVLAVNARGVAVTLHRSSPLLSPGGAIVAIASLNAWRGDPNLMSYVASKHAVLGIVRSAALELGRRGIRVNAVAPGPIATEALIGRMRTRERERGIPMAAALEQAAAQTALGRIATVEEVASTALFLASDLASGVTGQMLAVDGGIS